MKKLYYVQWPSAGTIEYYNEEDFLNEIIKKAVDPSGKKLTGTDLTTFAENTKVFVGTQKEKNAKGLPTDQLSDLPIFQNHYANLERANTNLETWMVNNGFDVAKDKESILNLSTDPAKNYYSGVDQRDFVANPVKVEEIQDYEQIDPKLTFSIKIEKLKPGKPVPKWSEKYLPYGVLEFLLGELLKSNDIVLADLKTLEIKQGFPKKFIAQGKIEDFKQLNDYLNRVYEEQVSAQLKKTKEKLLDDVLGKFKRVQEHIENFNTFRRRETITKDAFAQSSAEIMIDITNSNYIQALAKLNDIKEKNFPESSQSVVTCVNYFYHEVLEKTQPALLRKLISPPPDSNKDQIVTILFTEGFSNTAEAQKMKQYNYRISKSVLKQFVEDPIDEIRKSGDAGTFEQIKAQVSSGAEALYQAGKEIFGQIGDALKTLAPELAEFLKEAGPLIKLVLLKTALIKENKIIKIKNSELQKIILEETEKVLLIENKLSTAWNIIKKIGVWFYRWFDRQPTAVKFAI